MSAENTNETKYLDLHGTEILVDKVKDLIGDVRKEIEDSIAYTGGSNISINDLTINAIGYKYDSTTSAFAVGENINTATGNCSFAEGSDTIGVGEASHAEGSGTIGMGVASHAEGSGTQANGANSHAEGSGTIGMGVASHAEGYGTQANGANSHAEGSGTQANGANSHAEGSGTIGMGVASHAEGSSTQANGANSHAEGSYTQANGQYSHAEGNGTVAEVDYSHAEGSSTRALGAISHVEGFASVTGGTATSNDLTAGTAASGAYAHAEGNATIAKGTSSHSEGKKTFASGKASHAEGDNTTASGKASHAEGDNTTASGTYSHAEGIETTATGSYGSHAEGDNTTASGFSSHAEGYLSVTGGTAISNDLIEGTFTSSGAYAHAEGNATIAKGNSSHSEGQKTFASGNSSHAEGFASVTGGTATSNDLTAGTITTTGAYAHAEGNATIAKGNSSHSEGKKTFASGSYSHAEGVKTTASGNNGSHAEGFETKASGGSGSHAEGYRTIAYGIYGSHAEGYLSVTGGTATSNDLTAGTSAASGSYAHAEGNATIAKGTSSHSEGQKTFASGKYGSHAEGVETTASGNNGSHAEGYRTTASGNYGSHAEGAGTTASGTYGSHAEGIGSTASGSYGSHAEGDGTTASSTSSHAEGAGTTASGMASHAEGNGSTASGNYSHAEGKETSASGTVSHAEGIETSASGDYSHVEGHKNLVSGQFSHGEGRFNTLISAPCSHIEGANNALFLSDSHAEGAENLSHGFISHVEGTLNTVTGYSAHAEGFGNIASGDSAHVEGGIAYKESNYKYDVELSSATYNSSTGVLECISTTEIPDDKMSSCIMASFHFGTGTWDHENYWIKQVEKISTTNYKLQLHEDTLSCIANGIIPAPSTLGTIIKLTLMRRGNTASGNSSHAEGADTIASGNYSHAEGMNNTAPNEAQHVSGKYATIDNTGTAIFQVGVGSSVNDRKDALRIKTDGDIIIQQDNQEIVLQDKLDSLQKQIDGEISSWFFEGTPANNYYPASEWTDNTLKERHLGDTYTNINNATNEHFNNPDLWESGTTSSAAVGKTYESIKTNATIRLRTKELLNNNGETITIDSNYSFWTLYFDANKQWAAEAAGYTNSRTLDKTYPYVAFLIRNTKDTTLSPSIMSTLSIKVGGKSDYDPTAGQSWRWCQGNTTGDNVGWHWHKIADSDAVKALAEAAKAQQSANTAQSAANNAQSTANDVREDFDNLEIGGRNLLRYTNQSNYLSKFIGWKGTLSLSNGWIKVTQNQGQSDVGVVTSKDSKNDLLKGKEYVLSFDAYLDNSASVSTLDLDYNYLMFKSGGNYIITNGTATITKTPARYSIKFTYTGENTATFGAMIGVNMVNCPVYYVKNIKLAQGNKSTDWTPAPEEDFYNHISDVSLFGLGDGEVFLKVPKDTITSDDKVIIARYIRNKQRNRKDGISTSWLTYKGWVRPRKVVDGKSRDFVIPEFSATNDSPYTSFMLYDVTHKFNDTDKYQYWRLTNQGKNLVDFIASNNVCHSGDGGEFKFVNKTLGLCIQRGGVQITDYLKFTIKESLEGGLCFGRV